MLSLVNYPELLCLSINTNMKETYRFTMHKNCLSKNTKCVSDKCHYNWFQNSVRSFPHSVCPVKCWQGCYGIFSSLRMCGFPCFLDFQFPFYFTYSFILFIYLFLRQGVVFFLVQAGLRFITILLFQLLKNWGYRYMPPHPAPLPFK